MKRPTMPHTTIQRPAQCPHWATLAGAIFLSATLQAQAITPCDQPVFACTLATSGKQVQVCQHGEHVVYEFGPAQAAAELRLRRPLSAVPITPWNGMGWTYWSSMELHNGAWTYRLSSSYERDKPDAPGQGSITLLRNGKEVQRMACIPETLRERIESLASDQ